MNLIKAQDREYCRAIGVSNFPMDHLITAMEMGAEIINNQVEYHPFLDQSPLLGFLQAQQMSLTAYSPLAQGKVMEDSTILDIADAHGKTPAQIALRWLIEQDEVLAIPRSSNLARMRSNLEVFNFKLTEEDRARLDGLTAQNRRLVNPDFAPAWD